MGEMFMAHAEPAEITALVCAGVFFAVALFLGVWKWRQMMASPDHRAHPYVDIGHRAALMYSFAAMLLAVFASLSAFGPEVDLVATAVPLFYFAVAIGTYIVHALRAQTDNQFAERNFVTTWGTALLAVGEIGGFLVLFAILGRFECIVVGAFFFFVVFCLQCFWHALLDRTSLLFLSRCGHLTGADLFANAVVSVRCFVGVALFLWCSGWYASITGNVSRI